MIKLNKPQTIIGQNTEAVSDAELQDAIKAHIRTMLGAKEQCYTLLATIQVYHQDARHKRGEISQHVIDKSRQAAEMRLQDATEAIQKDLTRITDYLEVLGLN